MYNEQLEKLIQAALADGVLTDKERAILLKRAKSFGIDEDEFEMVLESRLSQWKKEHEAKPESTPPMPKVGKPEDLDGLITEYLADGIISSKEREVLLRKAQSLGIDRDEMDLYIDAQQQKADQKVEAAISKRRGKACPYCGGSIPDLTDKCPHCGESITAEASSDLEDVLEHLETALVNFKSGEDVKKNKAEVERYVRKAKMYFGNNPKIQRLVEEIEAESQKTEANATQQERKKNIVKYAKFAIAAVVVLGVIIAYYVYNNQPERNAEKTVELVKEAIAEKDFGKAELLIAAYTKELGQSEEDLGSVRSDLNAAYFDALEFDKLYGNVIMPQNGYAYFDEYAKDFYELTLKCIDAMKKKDKSNDEIKAFIDSKMDAYPEETTEDRGEWAKSKVRKRLYKHAGI